MSTDYRSRFEHILQGLNDAQRQAVDNTEGPVWVMAGPGTGKTHILAARIGRILSETDAQPYNILCLTFTDAGVHAMRERLLQFIGPEAHRVHIYTFHSFCNRIIQDNLSLFGASELAPISRLERLELIHELIDRLPSTHPLKQGKARPRYYTDHLKHLFRLMKMERWTPESVREAAKAYLESLPEREAFKYKRNTGSFRKGDLKPGLVEKAEQQMEELTAAADLFPTYQDLLAQRHRYDYEDMLGWVLDAFERFPWLRRRYQEQYLYLLVDEYQDTNGAQNEVMLQLIDYWEKPNVFIVGDDDQSIFEFQGARLQNLLDFYRRYEQDLLVVVLRENYRSTQLLLDRAGELIALNEERATSLIEGLDKHLRAALPERMAQTGRISLREYPGRLQEEAGIIEEIESLIQRGVKPEEIAVIYARHRQAENLIQLFKKSGLPYATRRNIDLLHLPLIRQLRQLLAYLDAEFLSPYSGEELLPQILHFGFTGVAPADIARLSLQAGADRPWRERIGGKLPPELSQESREAMKRFAQLIDEFLRALPEKSLPAYLEQVINRSGLMHYLLNHEDRDWHIQALHTFFRFVQTEVSRRPSLSLSELLERLEKMKRAGLPIEMDRNESNAQGVQFLTAHSAKGLEFTHVFLLDCVEDYWGLGRSRPRQFHFPDTLNPSVDLPARRALARQAGGHAHSAEGDALEARRRLFYVALTRARTHLYLTWAAQRPDGKPLTRSRFVDELREQGGLEIEPREVSSDQLREVQIRQLSPAAAPRAPLPEEQRLRERLENFRLSISALNRFIDCPLSFYYEHLLRLPRSTSESAAYGLAAHRALELLFETARRMQGKGRPGEVQLLSYFEAEMRRRRGLFGPAAYRHRIENGRRHLQRFFREHLQEWPEEALLEYRVREAEYEGVPLTGAIDRIDLRPQLRAHLIDYKTGRPISARYARPSEKNPAGGPYWRQLVFYKILLQSYDRLGRIADTGELVFIDPDSRGRFVRKTFELGGTEVRVVGELIRNAYRRITALDFHEGCGEEDCTWCKLLRTRQLPSGLAEEEIDGLDDG